MSVSKYAYVYARIRARMSELMDERRIRELVDAPRGDFLSLLMDTAYKDKFDVPYTCDQYSFFSRVFLFVE